MRTLEQIAGELAQVSPEAGALEVVGVTDDSRAVEPGFLFVAIEGLTVDGHDFAEMAAKKGAVAVLASRPLDLSVPCLVTDDPARALCLAAARVSGAPAEQMTLVGITGTNGKTTTTYMMESVLASAGRSPGVVGTVGYRYAGAEEKAPFTTPPPVLLHQVLGRMVRQGCDHLVMEVSSHALDLGRVWGLDFDLAAFTNLTQDHLDLHGSMEAYLQAKLLLFTRHLKPGGAAVINLDGRGSEHFVAAASARRDVSVVRCTTATDPSVEAEARLLEARHSIDGLRATLRLGDERVALRSAMLGAYNGENILLAAACCHAAGVTPEQIARGVQAMPGVPGRLERVDGGREFAVLVDYAHTPDALERAMSVLRPLCKGRLIVVFGCGGDRDQGKRPLMGAAVARGADVGLVTSDNPRTEDPMSIIRMIEPGVRGAGMPPLDGGRGYLVDPDRRQAIFAAVAMARPGDIVLIAGKGHEDYQILGDTTIHFDDREQAREALEGR